MKIKTQFIICIVVFSAILLIIGVSVAITEQQVSRLSAQEQISSSIERGASSLNNIAIQSRALAFDASQLSSSLNDQAHQANNTNTLLIVSLVGAFGAFLATIYLVVFRRALKSVAE